MNRGIRGFFALALIGGVFVAGCGGGGSSTSTSSSTPTTTSSSSTKAAAKTSTSQTSASHSGVSPIVAAAVTACKNQIAAVPTISSSEKSKLDAICQDAASGNAAAAKTAALQVCEQIAKSLPAGIAQQTALSACKSGKAPSGTGTTTLPTGTSVPTSAGLATIMQAACQEYTKLGSVLGSTIESELTSVCQKVAHGDLSAAKAELQQVCEQYVKLIPAGSEQATAEANCKKI